MFIRLQTHWTWMLKSASELHPVACSEEVSAGKHSPHASLWKYPDGITLTTVHLLAFFMAQQQQKKVYNVIFFILAGKVSSISVQDVQDKVRGGTECFAAWQISGRGDRVK